jgi:hypothetical protein
LIERLQQERPIEKMLLLHRFARGPETAVWEVMTRVWDGSSAILTRLGKSSPLSTRNQREATLIQEFPAQSF